MTGIPLSASAANLKQVTVQVLASLLTAMLLAGWTIWSSDTIGNDYAVWPFLPNLHAHYYATKGLPLLWYPFYTGGFPFGAMPGVQLFNLPAWILTQIPGYTEGGAMYWNSARYVLVFTLLHFLTARFLSTFLSLSFFAGFFVAAPIIYNMRSLDQWRYGVYLEVPFYLLAATLLAFWYYRQRHFATLAFVALFIQLALTGGHPPSVFYAVVAALLIVVFAVSQFLAKVSFDKRYAAISTVHLALATIVGFLMAAPNWWPTSENVAMNSARVINSTLEWSRDLPLGWTTLIANFFVPWQAEVHSAFGGSALYTVLNFGLFAFCARNIKRFWWALILLLFPIVYSFGGTLFELFYFYVPGFRWVRIPGRFMAMQPFFLLTSLAIGMAIIASKPGAVATYGASLRESFGFAAIVNLIFCLVLLNLVVFNPNLLNNFVAEGFTPQKIFAWSPTLRSIWLVAGILSSLGMLIALRSVSLKKTKYICVGLFLLFMCQAFVTNRFGTWITNQQYTPKTWEFDKANQLPFYHLAPFVGPMELDEIVGGVATTGYTRFMKSAGENAKCFLPLPLKDWSRKTILPFYLSRNLEFDAQNPCGLGEAYQAQRVQTVRCENNPGSIVVADLAVCEAVKQDRTGKDLIELNSRNRLRKLSPFSATLAVNTPHRSVFVTPYPWVQGYWKVQLDGKPVQGFQINAGMLGVLVPAGKHSIAIQYISKRTEWARWVVFGTTSVVVLVGLLLAMRRFPLRTSRAIVGWIGGVVVSGTVLFSCYDWAASYQSQVNAKILLPNNYADLLKKQIEVWGVEK